MSSIPVVDQHDLNFAHDFVAACRDIGFVTIVGHGIPRLIVDDMGGLVRRLFAVDEPVKERWRITGDNYRGFIPLGFFTPNRTDLTGTAPDWYEGFKLHWECPPGHRVMAQCRLYGPNRWPDTVSGLAQMRPIRLVGSK